MAHFVFSAFCDESGESTIGGQMAACKKNGITHMELRGFGPELNINKMTVEQAKAMKEEIDKEGMKVSSIGSAYGKINIKDIISHTFPLEKGEDAIKMQMSKESIKVIVHPQESDE